MNRINRVLFAGALVGALIACGGRERTTATGSGSPAASGKPLSIKGSDTMVILTQRLAEEYMKSHQGQVVQVNGGGSGTGIAALINGTVDLAMASRPMKDSEKEKASRNRGSEVVEHAIALDALAVFVNKASPVTQLTIEQVRDVYSGKITNWNALGGPDAQIVLYGRESSSGTYDYFREHVLASGDFAPLVQTLQGTAAIINAVGKDPNGIGYGGIAYASEVRAIGIAAAGRPAVVPNKETVADGTYPLSRKLFFYFPASAPERVKTFADWSLTPEAQSLVTQVGYFPLATTEAAAATGTGTDTASTGPATTATTRTQ